MKLSCIFPLVYEFGRGVRIFENIAGVRIRTLVYEKKNIVAKVVQLFLLYILLG